MKKNERLFWESVYDDVLIFGQCTVKFTCEEDGCVYMEKKPPAKKKLIKKKKRSKIE